DIGVVVLVVMELERFGRHVGLQRIVGVGKVRQLESHRSLLLSGWGKAPPARGGAGLSERRIGAGEASGNRLSPGRSARAGKAAGDHHIYVIGRVPPCRCPNARASIAVPVRQRTGRKGAASPTRTRRKRDADEVNVC